MITFGPFTLDPASGTLKRGTEPIPISHRALVLLQTLLNANGQPVSKTTLLDRAWPGQIVEEGNLTVQISALRKALGDDLIVTVPRLGYRLIVPSAATRAELLLPSLAVLPFQNLSGDPEQDYFADGVVEDIITALSRFKSFAVIARNSSFTYKGRAVDSRQIATELEVRYLLQGSVRRSGLTLRINAQLVDCDSGTQLWAQNFDGSLDDVFTFQDRITESVAAVVEPQIQQAEFEHARQQRPHSIAAYDIFLQARARIATETERDNAEAHAMLAKALLADPDNARILTMAAYCLEHRISMGWPPISADDARLSGQFARRALEHAVGDALVMAQCGVALIQGAKDYDFGMAAVRAAVDINPNSVRVNICAAVANLHCGSLDLALVQSQRALRLSPRDPDAYIPLCATAMIHILRGEHGQALEWATRSVTLNPNFDPVYWMLAAANAHLGHMDKARAALADLLRHTPSATITSIRFGQPAKDPSRMAAILDGLRLAGLPES